MTAGNQKEGPTTWDEVLRDPDDHRPHVVILGAGASRAAFPSGDANGKRLPLMDDLVEVVGLGPIIERGGFDPAANFEATYSAMHVQNPASQALRDLEEAIAKYFSSLELPLGPTLYDRLLAGLRPKDVVATFNWDPFLADACTRLARMEIPVPMIAHLHGNVRVGYCPSHTAKGNLGATCPECGEPFTPTDLLYPVTKKDYTSTFIEREWKFLRWAMGRAFTFTIFGYGAPAADGKAVALMKDGWSGERDRKREQTGVIDVKTYSEVREAWDEFIYSAHLDYSTTFEGSSIGLYPRRSCEAIHERINMGRPVEPHPFPPTLDWLGLLKWIGPMIEEERRFAEG